MRWFRKDPKAQAIADLWKAVGKAKAELRRARHPERTRMDLPGEFFLNGGRIHTGYTDRPWTQEDAIEFLKLYPQMLALLRSDYDHIERSNAALIARIRDVVPTEDTDAATLVRAVDIKA